MQQDNKILMTDAVDIGMLNPEDIKFFSTSGGFLGMKYAEDEHKRVFLNRILPFKLPFSYISVLNTEQKEIGIIKGIDSLDDESKALAIAELERRYYTHEITAILSVKDKMGYVYFNVTTTKGEKTFAVRDVNRNVRLQNQDTLVLFNDVDGNRYKILDYNSLDSKSFKLISQYLF